MLSYIISYILQQFHDITDQMVGNDTSKTSCLHTSCAKPGCTISPGEWEIVENGDIIYPVQLKIQFPVDTRASDKVYLHYKHAVVTNTIYSDIMIHRPGDDKASPGYTSLGCSHTSSCVFRVTGCDPARFFACWAKSVVCEEKEFRLKFQLPRAITSTINNFHI